MKIQTDEEATNVLLRVCEGALKYNGLGLATGVNSFNDVGIILNELRKNADSKQQRPGSGGEVIPVACADADGKPDADRHRPVSKAPREA